MKCPFLIKRLDILDDKGKKVGEDIRVQDCIKNECMVYDGAAKLCSLLSTNMKTGIFAEETRTLLKEFRDDVALRSDNVTGKISGTIEGMQQALIDRFAILRKQNEVMVLGFDRLSEIFAGKLGELKAIFGDLNSNMSTLQGNAQQIKDAMGTNEKIFNKFSEYSDTLNAKMDALNSNVEKITVNNQLTLESLGREISKTSTAGLDILKKLEVIDNIAGNVDNITNVSRTEIEGVRTVALSGLSDVSKKLDMLGKAFAGLDVQGVAVKFEDLLKNSSTSLDSMSNMMRDLNNNYVQSLGKIASLAEGMRQGVEKVGEGVHGSVKVLVSEMQKELGTLEKQFVNAFTNIAKVADHFDELNQRMREMTTQVQKEFKDSFERQAKLADHTKGILENIKGYFEREEIRHQEEQVLRKKKEGVDHFDRATLYYYRGNFELAQNEINKALEIQKNAEYLNLKGLILADLGKFEESQKTYSEALKVEPNLSEIHNNLGLLYLKMKKLDFAVLSFREALKKNVNYALAYVNLGKALIDLERFDDAIEAYTKALAIDPLNAEAKEAIKLYKEGKITE